MLQVPLNIQRKKHFSFDNFYPGNNIHIIFTIKQFLENKQDPILFLWGSRGSGCSHILHACCQYACTDKKTMVVSLREKDLTPSIFHSLENIDVICLDDIEAVLSDQTWCEALFHFYNRCVEKGVRLIFSAHLPPRQLRCVLPDLHSRLSAGLVFHVQPLNDDQKIIAMQIRAEEMGLYLSREVAQFMIRHYPRDTVSVFKALEKLDQSAWETKRRLTIPFVKEVLLFDGK